MVRVRLGIIFRVRFRLGLVSVLGLGLGFKTCVKERRRNSLG